MMIVFERSKRWTVNDRTPLRDSVSHAGGRGGGSGSAAWASSRDRSLISRTLPRAAW